jgi:hypothetical protein
VRAYLGRPNPPAPRFPWLLVALLLCAAAYMDVTEPRAPQYVEARP